MINNLPISAFDFPDQKKTRATAASRLPGGEPIVVPFVVVTDIQEKAPFEFSGILADSDKQYRPLIVQTVRTSLGNSHADYTIAGDAPCGTPFAQLIALERKSIADAVGTILGFGPHRDRFERELEWLNGRDFAAVVIEGEISTVMDMAEAHSSKAPGTSAKALFRSVLTWQQRFRNVHWQFCPDRRFAELYTFRALEKFWENKIKIASN